MIKLDITITFNSGNVSLISAGTSPDKLNDLLDEITEAHEKGLVLSLPPANVDDSEVLYLLSTINFKEVGAIEVVGKAIE